MNYAIYLRKSRADNELEALGEMETLSRHEKILLEYSSKHKFNIMSTYKEIVSGESIASRPEMQKLLTDVENGLYEGILVMEIERLARGDTMDQGLVAQTFKNSNTKIITPTKIYDPNNEFDEEYFEFGLFMSRREYKTINRRIQRGRIASVQEGKFIGSQPPFGYDKVRISNQKGYTLIPNRQAEFVKLIYDLYVNKNLGSTNICRELDNIHVKPVKSSSWSKDSIIDILSNPVYAGKIRWSYKKETKLHSNGKHKKIRRYSDDYILVDGLHEPIVPLELFENAQIIRKSKMHSSVKISCELKNPLSELVYCGKCGQLMRRQTETKRCKYDILRCPNIKCDNISSPILLIEEKLLHSLELWLNMYKIKYSDYHICDHNPKKATHHSLELIIAEICKLQKQLDSIYDLLEQGIYSNGQFLIRNQTLNERMVLLKAEKNDLENQIKHNNEKQDIKLITMPSVESLLNSYSTLPSATEKNMVLKNLLKKVNYIKLERNTKGHILNDNFELTIYPYFQ